ncbi:MAG TPA: hypothetical protein VNN79_03720 [Actinomycetota bacterium]|nr:hypothetical protein [Actinomycetota bacterium]
MRRSRIPVVVSLTAVFALLLTGTALAGVIGLPASGTQVNRDSANGINPRLNGGATDVAGGSLTAGATETPWITFEQKVAGGGQDIFVRSFNGTKWVTRGFPASLNIDPSAVAEAPAIDFAGPGRTVPWVTWYEPITQFKGRTNIFASRFCAAASSVCGAGNIWVREGQDRTAGKLIPSLNIHTTKDAEDPSVAGGTTAPGGNPGPWVTWREEDGNIADSGNHFQIFVSKPVLNASSKAACPPGTRPHGGNSVGFFCWQQVGLDRLAANDSFTNPHDPSLNIDPSRDGVVPDIAFTGPSDNVPWVVWYEEGNSHLGLRNNKQVFAAKGVADPTGDGGFHWQAVGARTAGKTEILDNSGAKQFGDCSASKSNEAACSLNVVPTATAEDPRVAAGTLVAGNPTVPWVVWAEVVGGGKHAIFIAHLVTDHFELFNGGQPLSTTTRDASLPDITFLGNEPVVTWNEAFPGGHHRAFVGHFTGGATSPAFVLDTPSGVPVPGTTTKADVVDNRPSVSSTCQADPFTSDGSACPGGGAGFGFFSFTQAGTPSKVFAERLK